MTVRELTIQRVSTITGAPFDRFIQKMEAQLGTHDPAAYFPLLTDPSQAQQVDRIVSSQLGSSGMMVFAMLPVGLLMALEDRPTKARQYFIGNSLWAFEMLRHDVRAGLSAPIRVLVYEDANGHAVAEYDLPSSSFGWMQKAEIDAFAKQLDGKFAELVKEAAR